MLTSGRQSPGSGIRGTGKGEDGRTGRVLCVLVLVLVLKSDEYRVLGFTHAIVEEYEGSKGVEYGRCKGMTG